MSTLPRQVAYDHCPIYNPERAFRGCKCGAPVTGKAHQEHVVEVTEAAVREQVAADLSDLLARVLADECNDVTGWASDMQMARPRVEADGWLSFCGEGSVDLQHIAEHAARIARGEVTP